MSNQQEHPNKIVLNNALLEFGFIFVKILMGFILLKNVGFFNGFILIKHYIGFF